MSSLMFEITTTINDEEIDDIQIFTVYRCAISKTASFAILMINLKTINYLLLEDDLRNNNLVTIPINIYQIEERSRKKERINQFCTKIYKVIQAHSNQPLIINSAYTSCTLYLVHPTLFYLNQNNSFNKILDNVTIGEVLITYQDFLKSTYGSFDFRQVIGDSSLNNFRYEQILLKTQTDLSIPTYLIQKYKPFNTFNFYFFDDFRLDEDSKGDITGYHINLSGIYNYPKRDIDDLKFTDTISMSNQKNSINIIDSFDELMQQNPTIIIKNNQLQYTEEKSQNMNDVPFVSIQQKEANINDNRTINSIFSTLSINKQQSGQNIMLYAPDTAESALERYHSVRQQLRETIQSIDTYFVRIGLFDFYQFGYAYNMQLLNSSAYIYTPISIVNIFTRQTAKIPMLIHNMWIQMIRFKEQ